MTDPSNDLLQSSPLTALDIAFADYLQRAEPGLEPGHRWLAALASHQFGQGHACLDLAALERDGAASLGWERQHDALLPPGLAAAARSLPWTQGPASPLVLEGSRLYLRRSWQAEQRIRAAVAQRLALPGTPPADLAATLELLFGPAGATTDWQRIACALAARSHFTLITGGPGTGKTTTVVRLLALLQSDATRRGSPLRIELAAPTGKAAARLSESIAGQIERLPQPMRAGIPTQASTLHKLLGLRSSSGQARPVELAADLVLVDEASMIDLEMMARLLAAVPPRARLILLGDKDQLASVEAGAVMGQLCARAELARYDGSTLDWIAAVTGCRLPQPPQPGSALEQQTAMLRLSRRFDPDSGIGLWASAVNRGDARQTLELWRSAPAWPNADAVVTRLQPTGRLDRGWLDLVRAGWSDWLQALHGLSGPADDEQAAALLRAFGQFQVLCAVREGPWGVQGLNQLIARELGFPESGWYAGRPVMVTRNDYALQLMNGDLGLCLRHARGLRVAFPDGRGGVRWVQTSRLDSIEDMFALTVHKSQGSEFEQVCLVLPEHPVAVLTRELVYTGITRARSRLHLVAPSLAVLQRAVELKVERSGGLSGL